MAASLKSLSCKTKQLIISLTDFKENEENFNICLEYAYSNFLSDKFLAPDADKIKEELSRHCEKLLIHSQYEKADLLSALGCKFDDICREDEDKKERDVKYGVLSMLIALADSPVNADYTAKKTEDSNEDASEANVDWKQLLTEEIEDYKSFQSDSDFSDYDDTKEVEMPVLELVREDSGIEILPEDTQKIKCATHHTHVKPWQVVAANDVVSAAENLVSQYWLEEEKSSIASSISRASNFMLEWDGYLKDVVPFYATSAKLAVREYQLMREVIWMLSGVTNLFLFSWSNNCYEVQRHVFLPHLSQTSLYKCLQKFTKYGTVVRHLHSFVTAVTSPSSKTCLTYQAFAAAISQKLQEVQLVLRNFEKDLIWQEKTCTLDTLRVSLEEQFKNIDVLFSILEDSIKPCVQEPNWVKASHLIGVLHATLRRFDENGYFNSNKQRVSLCFDLFMQTCKPYLDIIHSWIFLGQLRDPHKEFLVQRNICAKANDQNFWNLSFVTYDSKSALSRTLSEWYKGDTMLKPVCNKIVIAAKSILLLESLGKLPDIVHGLSNRLEHTLYDNFESSLTTSRNLPDKVTPCDKSRLLDSRETRTCDSLLSRNFQELFYDRLQKVSAIQPTASVQENVMCQSRLQEAQLPQLLNKDENSLPFSLEPIEVTIQNCLYPMINTRCSHICSELVRVVKDEHKLEEYLLFMKKLYLLQAGDAMYEFYSELFERMSNAEKWQDVSYLRMLLHDSLSLHYPEPDQFSRLSVIIEEISQEQQALPICQLNGLRITLSVPWPINVVIHADSQKTYNRVLIFLLQVKRAKYSLDVLRFEDLQLGGDSEQPGMNSVLIHKMMMFRVRLMHFVNSFHTYIMTRILHSTELEFIQDFAECDDLEQIMDTHEAYIQRIFERCLLHKKSTFIREAVMKVLNLAVVFHVCWRRGIHKVSQQSIDEMETIFARCYTFLSSFLNNVIKRGSYIHLESLAFALMSSIQY